MMDIAGEPLRTLAAVIDRGSFERAAEALRITPSAVSQRMKALEQQAGRVLVLRTKPIEPTEAGRILLRLARQVALLESEAATELGGSAAGRTTIPLVINADSLATWALPALATLPEVSFEITLDDQDHTLDRLRDGTAMAAVTSDPEPVPGCVVSRLGSMRYLPSASPAFRERWLPQGPTAEALARAPMLVFDRKDALQERYLTARGVAAHPPRHVVPASTEFVRAAELGLGWGMLPDLQATPLIADGRLIVLEERAVLDVPLYWQQWSVASSTLAAVSAAIAEAARSTLHQRV
ncbi:LysR family transcriptional regulator ArgP [Leifsonia poae]|uniref:LysR family transcriptional regulator ArgP n=1 Tax=Leifsonia poae TaxID=110933 RepID=UPI001CBD2285|nr:LysR family transcriptional regulator ArgP [Leifsonia poae]